MCPCVSAPLGCVWKEQKWIWDMSQWTLDFSSWNLTYGKNSDKGVSLVVVKFSLTLTQYSDVLTKFFLRARLECQGCGVG